MRLSIASLCIDIAVDDSLLESLPNLQPFAVSRSTDDSIICHVKTGQHIPAETTPPAVTSQSDEKIIRLWLHPDACKLSLSIPRTGHTYWLHTDRHWQTVQTDWTPSSPESFACLNDLILIAFVYRSAFYQAVTIHASCVAIDESGCAFIGPSGIGKSTHSRLWLQYIPGARLLNDDQPVLRLHSDGTVMLYGSPWSGKTSCYENEGVRLNSFFFMQQAPENVMVPLTGIETFQQLLKATSLIGRDTVTFEAISGTQAQICGKVPAYVFRNRPTKEAALLSYQTFKNNY